MFRETWAQITVPDRALTVGSLRYAHTPCPTRELLQATASATIGRSRHSLRRARRSKSPQHKMSHGAAFDSSGGGGSGSDSDSDGGSSRSVRSHNRRGRGQRQRQPKAESDAELELELVCSFFAANPQVAAQYEAHRQTIVGARGSPLTWPVVRSRVEEHDIRLTELEKALAQMQVQVAGK